MIFRVVDLPANVEVQGLVVLMKRKIEDETGGQAEDVLQLRVLACDGTPDYVTVEWVFERVKDLVLLVGLQAQDLKGPVH